MLIDTLSGQNIPYNDTKLLHEFYRILWPICSSGIKINVNQAHSYFHKEVSIKFAKHIDNILAKWKEL